VKDGRHPFLPFRVYHRSCRCGHIDFVLPGSRELRRRAEGSRFFRPPDGVGVRSDIEDVLDGVVASLLLEMSAAEFTARHVGSVHFHFTPKGASWLNMVEAWFSVLTRKSVRRGSFETVRALVRHIERYMEEWNSHPTPFVWTKEPADIIKKAVRRAH